MTEAAKAGLARGFANGPALVCYLMAGYPDRATSLACVRAAAAAGADVIELGVPYADPLADGPVIVEAARAARRGASGGFGLAETLELAAEFTGAPGGSDTPVALMTYLNPMLRLGLERLAETAEEKGVGGFIVPDLPPDNPLAARWRDAALAHHIDTVFLVAPTSTRERLETVAAASTGFIYCVSSVGLTGERESVPPLLAELVARVRAARPQGSDVPVAVGFGVAGPEQAAAVARVADAVVVGSAIVRRQADPEAVSAFVAGLAAAVHAR